MAEFGATPVGGISLRVGGADPLRLTAGPDELAVTVLDGPVVEKDAPLPEPLGPKSLWPVVPPG
jgi:hypothetical protein